MKKNQKTATDIYNYMESALRDVKDATKNIIRKKKYGVTVDQWLVLRKISGADEINQSGIAAATSKDPAAITRMIDLMVQKGLVQRKSSKTDKRASLIKLTRKGKGLVQRMSPVVDKLYSQSLHDISDRDLNAVRRVSNRIAENLG